MARYAYSQNIFDEIDSEDKAYWLGFIWSDGYVSHRPGGKGSSLKIGLSSRDIEHLQKFKDFMSATNPIKLYDIKSGFATQSKEARITLYGNHLANTLSNNYGIVPGRTDFSKIINNVPQEFYPDLIRGLCDADGCITSKEIKHGNVLRKEFSVSFMGSVSVLNFINQQLINNGLIEQEYTPTARHADRTSSVFSIRATGNFVSAHILKFLYLEPGTYLQRKRERVFDLFTYINDYVKETGRRKMKDGTFQELDKNKDYIQLPEVT